MKLETIDASTESKIKEAARTVFTRKGFAATKMRDIAAEADINLSLINYYFRSKEKLFRIIMDETIEKLFGGLQKIINDENSPFLEKIEKVADHYITLLLENANLPLFIVMEISGNPERFSSERGPKKMLLESHFAKQLTELKQSNKIDFNPLHLLFNLLGMVVFPFLARPVLSRVSDSVMNEETFKQMMEERKKMIPMWISSFLRE